MEFFKKYASKFLGAASSAYSTYKMYFIIGALVVAVGSVFYVGVKVGSSNWESKYNEVVLQNAEMNQKVSKLETKQAEATTKVVTRYVYRDREVKVKGDTIIKEVPVYVSKDANDQCVIPDGWVLVHNSAATNNPISGTTVDPNGTTTGVDLVTSAETIAENYKRYHELTEQVKALQDFIKTQQQLQNNTK